MKDRIASRLRINASQAKAQMRNPILLTKNDWWKGLLALRFRPPAPQLGADRVPPLCCYAGTQFKLTTGGKRQRGVVVT